MYLTHVFTAITHMNYCLHKMLMSDLFKRYHGTLDLCNMFLYKTTSYMNKIRIGSQILDFTNEIKQQNEIIQQSMSSQSFIRKYLDLHEQKCTIINKCMQYDSMLIRWGTLFIQSLRDNNDIQHAHMSHIQRLVLLQ